MASGWPAVLIIAHVVPVPVHGVTPVPTAVPRHAGHKPEPESDTEDEQSADYQSPDPQQPRRPPLLFHAIAARRSRCASGGLVWFVRRVVVRHIRSFAGCTAFPGEDRSASWEPDPARL
jgi:hypothetical protein